MSKRQKRSKHEGTFFRRADGRFEGRVLVGYLNGKPKYKSIIRKTQKEALAAWELLKRQHADGINIAPERQTIAQFLERWLDQVVSQRTRPTTCEIYKQSVRRITKHIGQMHLDQVSPHHVQAMLKALTHEGYAPATVDRARDILINAFNTAAQWELVPKNVATLTAAPRVERYAARTLSIAEAHQVLAAAHGDRQEALWRVGLSLGLRRGEALGLRWQDIDFEHSTLRIAVNLQRINGMLLLVQPKTAKSRRILPLPPSLQQALRQHQQRQVQERIGAGPGWNEHGLVFCTSTGRPIAPRNLLTALRRLLTRAGLPRMRFHDLRHSCLTLLAAQDVHPSVAQRIAGHSSIYTTLETYTQVKDESTRKAAMALDQVLDRDTLPRQPSDDVIPGTLASSMLATVEQGGQQRYTRDHVGADGLPVLTIRKCYTQRWHGSITVRDEQGAEVVKEFYGTTKREVVQRVYFFYTSQGWMLTETDMHDAG